ncbi:molybdopterin synthase sulfur carrier subunit [Chitiniphilus shinanonensis]|uniref:Molybdopterin synthase sulfur carrier subunit n=1 Tax=Chitiniphilus shinanonensis TaxID=553088 RepID=A0ABQ6BXP0_9NEIS|nr:MoaD/ThiS family protein [Chitiniphilus shinanonensis]GLS06167.1 molybdopterin synthase sulfur carrier subunit [Chitiniphilus shinanonensis]
MNPTEPTPLHLEVLYLARLRDTLGRSRETLTLDGPATVADLLALLRARGAPWDSELGGDRVFRVAVDQYMADPATVLVDGAEVALFPPVTGG